VIHIPAPHSTFLPPAFRQAPTLPSEPTDAVTDAVTNEVKACFVYLLKVTTICFHLISLHRLKLLLFLNFHIASSSTPSQRTLVSSQLLYPHNQPSPISSQHAYPHSRLPYLHNSHILTTNHLLYLLNFNIFLLSSMSNFRDKYIIAENQRLMREVWENVMAVIGMLCRINLSAF
jgi:hypothetical protein